MTTPDRTYDAIVSTRGSAGEVGEAGAGVRDLDGPTTLCALPHAPISSALSPNRYCTTPSSTLTCSDTSAMTIMIG